VDAAVAPAGRLRRSSASRRALLAIAAQATADDPACRPSLGAFIDAVRRAVPDARLDHAERPPAPPAPGLPSPDRSERPDGPRADDPGTRPAREAEPAALDHVEPAAPDVDELLAALDLDAPRRSRSGHRTTVDEHDELGPEVVLPPEPPPRPIIEDLLGELRPSGDRPDRTRVRLSGRRGGWLPAAAAVVAIGSATYFGLSAWWATPTGPAAPVAASDPGPADSAVSDPGSADSARSDPATPGGGPVAAAAAGGGGATPDDPAAEVADGPSAAVDAARPGEAPVVEHDGRRVSVGQPGDVAVVGPWACDGRPLLAVLRPSTGAVHVFREWAPPGGSVEAPVTAVVPGAASLQGRPVDDACAELVAIRADGTTVAVTEEAR
jgi:hypothetical protein